MDIAILLAILVFTLAAFSFEWMPIDVVALSCLGLLLLFDLISAEEAITGFSNPAVITVMMMFILSYGLTHTGLVRRLGEQMERLARGSFTVGSGALLLTTGALSGFVNNTAAMAIFMPVGIQMARHFKTSPARLLLPLSYVSIAGGTCTLIGTSTNLLVSALALTHGYPAFSVFEFFRLGAILFLVGGVYTMLVPARLLRDRRERRNLTRKYRLSAFLTEVRVPASSPLVGRTVVGEQLRERFQLNVLEMIRGEERIAADLRVTQFEPDDLLIVRGNMEDIVRFKDRYGLLLLTDVKLVDSDLRGDNAVLVEVQLSPVSRLVGQSIKEIDFRRRYGCFVLALNRTGAMIREKLTSIPLRQWDTLLVFGPRTRVEALYGLDDFVPLQELDLRLKLPRRWWLGVAVIPIVVLLAALGIMSILKAAILGVITIVLGRVITIQQAYDSVNWTVIFLLAGILPLGIALENTGLAAIVGEHVAAVGQANGPLAVLAMIYVVTAILSEIVSNNSTAVLMVPIALSTAESLGLDAKPFLMAVAFAASASFMTPMGYQTNAMVYGPGGYRFLDYVVFGTPLKILFLILSVWLIPVFWPFG